MYSTLIATLTAIICSPSIIINERVIRGIHVTIIIKHMMLRCGILTVSARLTCTKLLTLSIMCEVFDFYIQPALFLLVQSPFWHTNNNNSVEFCGKLEIPWLGSKFRDLLKTTIASPHELVLLNDVGILQGIYLHAYRQCRSKTVSRQKETQATDIVGGQSPDSHLQVCGTGQ